MRPPLPTGWLCGKTLSLGVALLVAAAPSLGRAQSPYFGGETDAQLDAHVASLQSQSHPYWLADGSTLALLKSRRTQAPWKSWYDSLRGTGNGVPTGGIDTSNGWWEYTRLGYLAMAYLLEDAGTTRDAFLAKIRASVAKLPTGNLADDQAQVNALVWLSITYDLAYPGLSTAERDHMRATATTWVTTLESYNEGDWMLHAPGSNHHHRQSVAITLAGLCFGEAAWIKHGLKNLKTANDRAFSADGLFDHGPSYLEYGLHAFPLVAVPYLRRFNKNLLAVHSPLAGSDLMLRALLLGRRPDGWNLNYDDASYALFDPRQFVTLVPDPDAYRWAMAHAPSPPYLPELFFLFEDGASTEPPLRPTQFLMGEHHAYFRRDWSPQSSYLALLGETHPSSAGHHNFDQTSFVFYAHGQMLCLDPGYGDWATTHGSSTGMWDFVSARAHNLILADGTGPVEDQGWVIGGSTQIDEARLTDMVATPFVDTAAVSCSYAYTGDTNSGGSTTYLTADTVSDVAVVRTVLYVKQLETTPENEYALVLDRVTAAQQHDYDWVLHADGQLAGTGNEGRSWTKNAVELTWRLYSSAPLSISTAANSHFDEARTQQTHTRLMARATAQRDLQFLSVLYPRTGALPAATIERIGADAGVLAARIAIGTLEDVAFVQPPGFTAAVGGLASDGTVGLLRRRQGNISSFTAQHATRVTIDDGLQAMVATAPITIALQYDWASQRASGQVEVDAPVDLTLACPGTSRTNSVHLDVGTHELAFDFATCGAAPPQDSGIPGPDAGIQDVDGGEPFADAGDSALTPVRSGCGCSSTSLATALLPLALVLRRRRGTLRATSASSPLTPVSMSAD